jgi:hypothetical protein
MTNKLKNIVLAQVVIILILTGMVSIKNKLVDYMTEYQVEYNLVVKK